MSLCAHARLGWGLGACRVCASRRGHLGGVGPPARLSLGPGCQPEASACLEGDLGFASCASTDACVPRRVRMRVRVPGETCRPGCVRVSEFPLQRVSADVCDVMSRRPGVRLKMRVCVCVCVKVCVSVLHCAFFGLCVCLFPCEGLQVSLRLLIGVRSPQVVCEAPGMCVFAIV